MMMIRQIEQDMVVNLQKLGLGTMLRGEEGPGVIRAIGPRLGLISRSR